MAQSRKKNSPHQAQRGSGADILKKAAGKVAKQKTPTATINSGRVLTRRYVIVGVIARGENFKQNLSLGFLSGELFTKSAYKRAKQWLRVFSDLAIFCAFGHAVNPNA